MTDGGSRDGGIGHVALLGMTGPGLMSSAFTRSSSACRARPEIMDIRRPRNGTRSPSVADAG